MDILIAGNDAISRRALGLLLETKLFVVVVGEAGDATTLFDLAEKTRAPMILIDGELVGADAVELIEKLHRLDNRPDVIALSSHQESRAALESAGVDAFVWKVEAPRVLLATVKRLGLRRGHE